MAEVARADQYLVENFQIGLLTDDDINYEDESGAERGVGFTGWTIDEGPNAKNTVIEFSAVCNQIIPDDHPPYGFHCRGGFITTDGEVRVSARVDLNFTSRKIQHLVLIIFRLRVDQGFSKIRN